ncbi:MAG: O-antigen translocase [Chitinophagaceae bacterium]|nr:O-antigen translocase [Chitinophagaceae bacterium]
MLLKLKKIFTTDLVKVSFLNAVATLIRMLTGFISVKVVASTIGPSGIALLGQLTNFSNMLLTICAGGMNTGMTKHIAQYGDSVNKQKLFLSTGFRITAFLSVICGITLIIGAGYFSRSILKDPGYEYIFHIFGATIILYAFNAMLVAVLNGYREFKKYVVVNITGSLTGLLFSVILALNFGIPGALIAAVTYQSVVFFVTLAIVTSSKWFKWRLFFAGFSKTAAIRLAKFALMTLVSVVAINQSQLIVRSYIAKTSLDNAGLWEGVNRISTIYLQVITTSLSVYYLPKLSGLKEKFEIRNEIISVYKLVVPFLLLTSLAIFFFRGLIINILFTEKFQDMEGLFAFQLAGDFFKMITWVLGYVLLAKAMTKTFIIVEIVSCTLFALLSILFIDQYGTIGATMGYAAGFLIQFIIMLFVLRKILFSYEHK